MRYDPKMAEALVTSFMLTIAAGCHPSAPPATRQGGGANRNTGKGGGLAVAAWCVDCELHDPRVP